MILPALFFQKRLQDEGGGYLVDYAAVLPAGVACFGEELVGFAGGQALVPQVDGEAGELSQLIREGLRFGGAGACCAGEMGRVADDDAGDSKPPGEACDGAQVVSGAAADFDGHNGLGGESEFVGDGDADALRADIESEIAGF